MSDTDRIERSIVLRVPRSRVWHAISDAREFGTWFRVVLDGDFVPGTSLRGRITHPGYEHVTMELQVERVEPESLLSYRWHPYAVQPDVDYSTEPTTLVEFHLDEVADGTRVRIVESGFDRLPASRRDEALRMNGDGWSQQIRNVEAHVAAA
jgi:uncharacterized protein YndB with AHSA1/START domain